MAQCLDTLILGRWNIRTLGHLDNLIMVSLKSCVYKLESIINFAKFRTLLRNKCELMSIIYESIDESYTTRLCSVCGAFLTSNCKRNYSCNVCQVDINRDINASRNIFLKQFMNLNSNNNYNSDSDLVSDSDSDLVSVSDIETDTD